MVRVITRCFIIIISNNKWKMKSKENLQQNESLVNEKAFRGNRTYWQLEQLSCFWFSLPVPSPSFYPNLCFHLLLLKQKQLLLTELPASKIPSSNPFYSSICFLQTYFYHFNFFLMVELDLKKKKLLNSFMGLSQAKPHFKWRPRNLRLKGHHYSQLVLSWRSNNGPIKYSI